MRTYVGEEFESFYDQESARVFADIEFRKCRFNSCAISMATDPNRRSIVRRVRLEKCETSGSALESAICEDIVVDGLKTAGLLQCWGAVFNRVTFRGRIGRVMLSPAVASGLATPSQQRAFDEANADYYRGVNWALDISEAEFVEGELQGVPARLIRRDPETQVVVTRERAARGEWRKLDLSKTHWPTSLEFFLERGEPDVVLVAPKRGPRFRELLDGLRQLREAGVAE